MTLAKKARDEIIKVYKQRFGYLSLLNSSSASLVNTTISDSQFKSWSTNGFINAVPISTDSTNELFVSDNNVLDNNAFTFEIAGRRNGKAWGYNTLVLTERVSGGHKVQAEIRVGTNTVQEDTVRMIPEIRITLEGR